jgi:cation diffusion facilitator CzcD-associated flavoprotein CzcO
LTHQTTGLASLAQDQAGWRLRAFKNLGINFNVFERRGEVDGVWDFDNPGTPTYASAHFISSKTHSYFSDFPMPDRYPDCPSY